MSSEISTRPAGSFQAWHFYLLLGMAAATVAVWRAVDTQPAALLLLSGAVLAAGLVAIGVHYTILAFLGDVRLDRARLDDRTRAELEQEKARVLRSIKELEFDRAMRKVGDADYEDINTRLRARALSIMEQLEQVPEGEAPAVDDTRDEPAARVDPRNTGAVGAACPSCGAANDADARFCKACGSKVAE